MKHSIEMLRLAAQAREIAIDLRLVEAGRAHAALLYAGGLVPELDEFVSAYAEQHPTLEYIDRAMELIESCADVIAIRLGAAQPEPTA